MIKIPALTFFLSGWKRAFPVSCLLLLAGLPCSFAQIPQLTIPVGHSESVTSLAFSPDGQYVLTASLDRTAKLWNRQGQELVTFSQHSGYIFDAAISPDGRYVITGADDATAILWNMQGQALHTFEGHQGWIRCLAFAPNSQRFVTGGNDGQGFMWDLRGRLVQALPAYSAFYNDLAYSGDGQYIITAVGPLIVLLDDKGQKIRQVTQDSQAVYSVAFSPDAQRIVAGTEGGRLMLWSLQGEKIWDVQAHEKSISAVDYSADGDKILSSGSDGTIRIWTTTGQLIHTISRGDSFGDTAFSPDGASILSCGPETEALLWTLEGEPLQSFRGYAHAVFSVAFAPDGQRFLTGNDDGYARIWDPLERRARPLGGHNGPVTDIAYSRDGNSLLTSGDGGQAVLRDGAGNAIWATPEDQQMRAAALSPDGQTIITGDDEGELYWWNQQGEQLRNIKGHEYAVLGLAFGPDSAKFISISDDTRARLWSLQGDSLATFSRHENTLFGAAFSPDGKLIATSDWDNLLKLWGPDGEEKKTISGFEDVINDIAFMSNSRDMLLASDDRSALLMDPNGQILRGFFGHTSGVTSLSLAPQGRFLLTGSRDKTARIWDLYTGVELATLIALGQDDWVVTTASGLFDASPGALKRLYYVLGLEVIDLEQLKERYYEPGLLPRLLSLEEGAIRDVDALGAVELYPRIKARIEGDQLYIELEARSGGLGKLSLFINQKEIVEDANPERLASLNIPLSGFEKYLLPGRPNEVVIRAYNSEGWLKSQPYVLFYDPVGKKGSEGEAPAFTPTFQTAGDPQLFILCIGTADYNGERLDLKYPDKDAADMAAALSSAGAALFTPEKVRRFLLSTDARTAEAVSSKENIRRYFADIAQQARPEDVFILYLSGHGQAYGSSEKAQFYYLTKDIAGESLSDPTIRTNYAISTEEFTRWLNAIPAQKQVMMIDACNSGKVVESLLSASRSLNSSQIRALDRMQGRTGVFVLAGSAADKVSYEASKYGQGLLTFSLLQGMSGLALREGQYVDIMSLFQYSRDQTPQLAEAIGGIQTPMMAFPLGGESFDIGLVDAQVQIPLARVKPVFIRNNFQEINAFDDVLNLGQQLEAYLQEITAKGAQASLIYVDVPEYRDAYSIKGLYELDNGKVSLRAKLFRGREPLGNIEVTGQAGQTGQLVERLLEQAIGLVPNP